MESSSGDLNFDQFTLLYQKIIFQSSIFSEYIAAFVSGPTLSLSEFQAFLKYEQRESFANDIEKVKEHLMSYMDKSGPLQLTHHQFMDYLYSKHNQVCQLSESTATTDDMNRPLSHYWISSSHNTYLTGDQITSESSCEAYVRCLRSGCKCLELDCWDGDKEPIIYHGRTLTSKILFMDVLETIKMHAWDVSDYPLILSIENHCSIPQQQRMAEGFKKVFGDMLLKEPIKGSFDHLPSPYTLRRKIILKNKKLKAGSEFVSMGDEIAADDISQHKMSGLLHLQDPVDSIWKPHFFVLTCGKLIFTDETETNEGADEEPDEEDDPVSDQRWFHSNVSREQCMQVLETFAPALGDGAFLVRPSSKGGGFSLSFWRQGVVNHCKVTTIAMEGTIKYSLIDMVSFDNLKDLIEYYQTRSLHCRDFTQILGQPVTSNGSFTKSEWYHESMSRDAAYEMLSKIQYDGAFLIRRRDDDSYAISFRAEGKIKHCRFGMDQDGLFSVGNSIFDSLEELVDYYRKTPLYRKMKLRYPTNQNLVARIGTVVDDGTYAGYYYINPSDFTSEIYGQALYDYRAKSETELSFKQGAIIRNVNKVYENTWWRGDHGEQKQGWFPVAYVQELDGPPEDDSSLGSLQKGEMNLQDCSIINVEKDDERFPHRFRITSPEEKSLEVACLTEDVAKEWGDAIRDSITKLTAKAMKDWKRSNIAKRARLAIELSDLIVYCQTVDFNPLRVGPPEEMSSLPENKAEKCSGRKHGQTMNRYNQRQLSRIYPKGKRIDSSNYDPTPMWSAGCQLAALNFQTPDLPMQLNHGKFLANGGCGYILKPEVMCKKDFDPHSKPDLEGPEPLSIAITILGARHLPMRGRDIPSSYLQIDIHGCQYDAKFNSSTTCIKNANGLNPVWLESCVFDINNPELALIKFTVLNSDIFGDANFLGQATYPVKSLRNGYRSVPIKNGYSEEMPLSALLLHLDIGNPKEDYQDVYTSIQMLQEEQHQVQYQLEELKLTGNTSEADRLRRNLGSMKRSLQEKKNEREHRIMEKKKRKPKPVAKTYSR